MATLVAVYLIKHHSEYLTQSLSSVSPIADEIWVFDFLADPDIAQTCQQHSANYRADGDWQEAEVLGNADLVLLLDGRDILSEQIKQSIAAIKKQSSFHAAYSLQKTRFIFGKNIDPPLWPLPTKKHNRLFSRDTLSLQNFLDDKPLSADIEGEQLKGHLNHHLAATPEIWLEQRYRVAKAWAEERSHKGERAGLVVMLCHGIYRFFKEYIVFGRFLCGKVGLVYAIFCMQETLNNYALLYERNKQGEQHDSE